MKYVVFIVVLLLIIVAGLYVYNKLFVVSKENLSSNINKVSVEINNNANDFYIDKVEDKLPGFLSSFQLGGVQRIVINSSATEQQIKNSWEGLGTYASFSVERLSEELQITINMDVKLLSSLNYSSDKLNRLLVYQIGTAIGLSNQSKINDESLRFSRQFALEKVSKMVAQDGYPFKLTLK